MYFGAAQLHFRKPDRNSDRNSKCTIHFKLTQNAYKSISLKCIIHFEFLAEFLSEFLSDVKNTFRRPLKCILVSVGVSAGISIISVGISAGPMSRRFPGPIRARRACEDGGGSGIGRRWRLQ